MTNPVVYQYISSFVSKGSTVLGRLQKAVGTTFIPNKKFAADQMKDF